MSSLRSFHDGAVTAIFGAMLMGTAWLIVFGHRGLAPMLGTMALVVALRREIWRDGLALLRPRRVRREAFAASVASYLGFSLWIAAASVWSPSKDTETLWLGVILAAPAAGAVVWETAHRSMDWRRSLATGFCGVVLLAALALAIEGLSGGWLRSVVPPVDDSPYRWKDMTALGRGVTALSPMIFPAAALLRLLTGSWIISAVAFCLSLVAAATLAITANSAALIAGAFAFVSALAMPRRAPAALAAVFLAALLIFPLAAAAVPSADIVAEGARAAPVSWRQRLLVWDAAATRALTDCLPLGCGADYARVWRADGATITLPGSVIPLPEMPIHPHNLFIQIWLELGLPGVLLFAAAILAGARALLRAGLDRLTAAAVAGAVAATLVSFLLEASLWQVWRLAAPGLAAFGCALSYWINHPGVESAPADGMSGAEKGA